MERSSSSEQDLENLLHECMVPCIELCLFEDLDSGLVQTGGSAGSPGSAPSPAASPDPALRHDLGGLQHPPMISLQPGTGGAPGAAGLSRTATTPAQPFHILAGQQQQAAHSATQWTSPPQQQASSTALSRALSEPHQQVLIQSSHPSAASSMWFGRSRASHEEATSLQQQVGTKFGQVGTPAGGDGASSAASHHQLFQQSAAQQGPASATQLGQRPASLDFPRAQQSASHPLMRISAQHSSSGGPATTGGIGLTSFLAATPDPTSMAATTDLIGLPKDQYQLLLNASAAQAPTTDSASPATLVAPTGMQLDQAEALWQSMAAGGADDQTLLSLATSLGLIVTDATGNMLLTRELRQANTPLPAYSLLDTSSLAAAAAAVSAPGVQDASVAVQQSALVNNLLRAYGGLRLPTSTPGSKPQGSPGPGPSKQHTLYKTELCRGWLESGTCRYGSKCQFAHGREELRPVPRHPKYKTEVCRSFTATGVCAYGPRCRFIHGTVSEPINVVDSGAMHKLLDTSDTLEGVLGFDSQSPTQSQDAVSRSLNQHHSVLAALAGPLALRQAAQAAAQQQQQQQSLLASMTAASGQDTADLTRRNLLVSLASLAGQQRASFDSGLPRGRSSLSGLDLPQRSCLSDMQRSSLESRGRTSFESAQSQQDWSQQQVLTAEALAGYMPGIPECSAMPYLPNEQWPGTAPAGSAATAATNNPFSFRAPSPASLMRQFPGPARSVSARNSAEILRVPAAAGASATPAWWNDPNASPFPAPGSELHNMQSSLLSAYSSGLYSASGVKMSAGAGSARLSNPGIITPETSDVHAGLHSSDIILSNSSNFVM